MVGIWKRDFPPFDVLRRCGVVRGEKVSGSFSGNGEEEWRRALHGGFSHDTLSLPAFTPGRHRSDTPTHQPGGGGGRG